MSDELLPCPFCGAGTTEIRENGRIWQGMKYSEPASVSVRHWCAENPGQPSRMIERVGRDRESALAAWNTRAALAHDPGPADEPCQDCDGRGIVGEVRYMGEFQPPEYDRCPSCGGSGKCRPAPAAPKAEPVPKLWLWMNFVDGRPEYWAFDNPYPIGIDHNDPQTLGEPCGYLLVKPSRHGRKSWDDAEVLRRSMAAAPAPAVPSDEDKCRRDAVSALLYLRHVLSYNDSYCGETVGAVKRAVVEWERQGAAPQPTEPKP